MGTEDWFTKEQRDEKIDRAHCSVTPACFIQASHATLFVCLYMMSLLLSLWEQELSTEILSSNTLQAGEDLV